MTEADSGLIWTRPEPGERRPRFSREQIAAAALRIADADGFDAVTMKRIAAELGAGTMTLYYYVRTKADIVALMQDAILAEVLLPEPELPTQWRDAVAAIARRTRQVLLAHPWSLATLGDAQFGPNAVRHIEQSLAALRHTELAPRDRLALLAIVDDYVVGNALHTVESTSRAQAADANPALTADAIAFGTQQLATGDFPHLAALYEHTTRQATPQTAGPPTTSDALTAQFETGLQALLDGLDARMIAT
jgi:AcrR family transcriptional regulator